MLCALFCGFEEMSKAESPSNSFLSSVVGIVYMQYVVIPMVLMIGGYILIYIKIRQSQKLLKTLGMSAHSVHKNDVSLHSN